MEISESKAQILQLPLQKEADWKQGLSSKLNSLSKIPIEIDCRDWFLDHRDLQKLNALVNRAGLKLAKIHSSIPETIVSANALCYPSELILLDEAEPNPRPQDNLASPEKATNVLFQQGTLRSGDHLKSEGDVLVLGDVNPGAKISAVGDVMIWGRLRGIAHAGMNGNKLAKITAMQLWPLQLRIAESIARGPEERPQEGLTEEARIKKGQIVIEPAKLNIFKK